MTDQLDRLTEALKDRYAIQRELGRGGSATVYLATDLRHDRQVAIKVLRPELAAALGPERFLGEIKTTANLHHPHILPLHDSGEAGGFLFYVMPLVEGESLRDRLTREKQLPLDDALQISREVADALSYAHAHGVIHRDIKPENILLESGHAVVADFGIARAVDQAGGEQLTETGLAIGTPAYMSPEQAAGSRDLDGRSDLYSLGCVLYEMLAGQPPFAGPTAASIVHQHLTVEARNITAIRPAVPASVAATLERALSKTPADRFNLVALFAEALGQPGTVPSASMPRRRSGTRTALLVSAAVVVIGGAVAAGWWSRSSPTGSGASRTAIAVLPFQNLSTEGPNAYFAGGLHEELLTQLTKVAALTVMGRTTVAAYAGTRKPPREIAAELGVGSIVEGSVQVAGDRLRVNVTLLDAETGTQLWAERYDRTLDDVFAIQTDVAQQVVAAVGAALSGAEANAIAAVPTNNPEAYRLFLQGEEYRRRDFSEQNLVRAQQFYQRALTLDSTFALALASLSVSNGYMHWFGYDPGPARLARQRMEAEAALRLGPDLPQAHWAMGMMHYFGWDFGRALTELTVAAKALPGSAELSAYVGFAHRRLGDWEQALAAYEKAVALDPYDATLISALGGFTLRFLHRYGDAIVAFTRALELAPDLAGARLQRAGVYVLWRGQLDSLRRVLESGPETFGFWGSRDLWRARLALWERQPDTLLAVLGPPEGVSYEAQGSSYEPGFLYAGWAHHLRRDRGAATQAFTGAIGQLDSILRELPDDWRLHASRGLALAALGRPSDARQEANWLTRSVAYTDSFSRPRMRQARALIFAQAGLADDALAEIEPLLTGPSFTSVHELRLDPRWDPIRDDPRFQALLVKYANPELVR